MDAQFARTLLPSGSGISSLPYHRAARMKRQPLSWANLEAGGDVNMSTLQRTSCLLPSVRPPAESSPEVASTTRIAPAHSHEAPPYAIRAAHQLLAYRSRSQAQLSPDSLYLASAFADHCGDLLPI